MKGVISGLGVALEASHLFIQGFVLGQCLLFRDRDFRQ